MGALSIGQVARAAGVGVETVRFYEREGLVPEPPRRASGHRQYPPEAVDRLRLIRRAKDLGFTLREIRELLDLRIDPERTCGDVRARAEAKMADIDKKVRMLTRMRAALASLVSACDGAAPISECPILDALDDEEAGDGAR